MIIKPNIMFFLSISPMEAYSRGGGGGLIDHLRCANWLREHERAFIYNYDTTILCYNSSCDIYFVVFHVSRKKQFT